jgi:glucuronokinase
MDFERSFFKEKGYGKYEVLDPACLPPLYLAYRRDLSQISGIYHSNLRQRWEDGDEEVTRAMIELAEITTEGRQCLLEGDIEGFAHLMDRNFDIRACLVKLDPFNVGMVRLARENGVSAKYAGSGGAIVGVLRKESQFEDLRRSFAEIGCEVIRPVAVEEPN